MTELPWGSFLSSIAVFLVISVLVYQFNSLNYTQEILSESSLYNVDLSKTVSLLTSNLEKERIEMEASLAEQSNSLSSMKTQLDALEAELEATQQANEDLTTQVTGYRAQNDVLRQKLETILGSASRSGVELSPSPVGASGLTLEELQVLTKGTSLAGIEPALLQIEKDYNCNALFALAVAKLETGLGTSENCVLRNNIFGILGRTGWVSYATKSDSVIHFGKIMQSNYFSKGFVTLDRIGPRYAEGSTTWAPKAKMYMLNDLRKIT
jgi:flagellum-specific peptidoglycan hydrolase FlgJ